MKKKKGSCKVNGGANSVSDLRKLLGMEKEREMRKKEKEVRVKDTIGRYRRNRCPKKRIDDFLV